MSIESLFRPWRLLRDHHDDVEVSCRYHLPNRVMGLQVGRRIWLARGLTQAERRCTLTHELVHRERGPVPADPAAAAAEERIVDEISSRRLITLPALTKGLRWTRHPRELAEHLWADQPTLETRMSTLDPLEVSQLEHHLEDQWLRIPDRRGRGDPDHRGQVVADSRRERIGNRRRSRDVGSAVLPAPEPAHQNRGSAGFRSDNCQPVPQGLYQTESRAHLRGLA